MGDVQVTNRNKFPLKGRFGGKDYLFPPGESVAIPEKAAEHIFALTEERENKTGALNRLGLLSKPGATLETAYKALDRVTLREGHTVFESPEPMPPPSEEEEEEDEEEEEEEEAEPEEESEPEVKLPPPVVDELKTYLAETADLEENQIGDSPGAPRTPGGESEAEAPASVADALDMDTVAREVLERRRKRAAHGG